MKVSICIPTYCQIEYLRETLCSVLSQDFQDFEVIVTDDSPDDSVCDLLSKFDFGGRLRYFRNSPALGSPENWNAALRLAQGDYVKILHHDDHFIRPDALRQFVKMLDDDPSADFGFCATQVNHVDIGVQRIHCASDRQLADLADDPASLFLGNCIGAPSVTICRRSANLDYDRRMKWLVDVDYYYRILMNNRHFVYTNEVLISTPTNVSHQVTEICRDNGAVELGEAMMLFEKFSSQQRENRLVKEGWMILFRRFRMRKLDDFLRYGLHPPIEESEKDGYFTILLKRPGVIGCTLLLFKRGLRKFFTYLPSNIQRELKRLYWRAFSKRFPN